MIIYLPNFADHILFFLLGIIMPFRSIQAQKQIKNIDYSTSTKIQMYWINGFGLWAMAVVVMLVWYFSDRYITDLGLSWPPPPLDGLASTLIGVFVVLYLLDVGTELATPALREKTFQRWLSDMPFLPAKDVEWVHFNFLSLSAGICEEIVFRGFFITYLYSLLQFLPSGSAQIIAVLFPAIIFGFVHYYQGWKAMVKISLMAILFGYIFLLTQSLWLLMIMHFLVDLLGGTFSWWLHQRYGSALPEE